MLEKALHGSRRYYIWLAFLGALVIVGAIAYSRQLNYGLGLTGISRDVPWGLYISQFTFLAGISVTGVMVAIPHYLHNFKAFAKVVILGEFLAVAAVIGAILFVVVDLGQPARVMNVLLYPSPWSIMFWDIVVLGAYLLVSIVIGWTALAAEKKGLPVPRWAKVLTYLSIPLAIAVQTVEAFLYAGLPGKDYWATAILAARFLSSAFASGPALLIMICMIIGKVSSFKVLEKAIDALAKIVLYAIVINVFFFLLEVFTALYSQVPAHQVSLTYLFFGYQGHGNLMPFMWAAAILAFIGIFMLAVPKLRHNKKTLVVALLAVFFCGWLDKGLGLVLGGFVPDSFGRVMEYTPTVNEVLIISGIYGIAMLVLTILYKVVIAVRRED
ncbi:MAG: polysulfide reductase NrfD [Actinomycetia bacterium]|nr:polysulfide reductase NrfD [Actinomycetes bacterium]